MGLRSKRNKCLKGAFPVFFFPPPILICRSIITLGSVSYKKSYTPQAQYAVGLRAGTTWKKPIPNYMYPNTHMKVHQKGSHWSCLNVGTLAPLMFCWGSSPFSWGRQTGRPVFEDSLWPNPTGSSGAWITPWSCGYLWQQGSLGTGQKKKCDVCVQYVLFCFVLQEELNYFW